MYNIYYLNFNNRFNRKIKRYDTIESYEPYIVGSSQKENFKWHDEMRTTITANIDEVPNYCLVCDENNIIVGRWFVVDGVYNRGNQYTLSLERDTIADYYWQLMNLPMYIQRGTIRDINDPSIYIKQGNFNQIKKKEVPLKDQTTIPWVVGYINKATPDTTISTSFADVSDAYVEVNGITNWEHYNKTYSWDINATTWFRLYFKPETATNYCYPGAYAFSESSLVEKEKTYDSISPIPSTGFVYTHARTPSYLQDVEGLLATIRGGTEYFTLLNNWLNTRYDVINDSELSKFNGKIIKDTATGICYRVKLNYDDADYSKVNAPSSLVSYLDSHLVEPTYPDELKGTSNSQTWQIGISVAKVKVELTQVMTHIKTTITSDRNHLEDAPYDMFCIPFGKIAIRYGTVAELFDSNKDAAIAMATAISEQLGDNCFDIQLLPYFPCQEILKDSDTNLRVARTKYHLIKDSSDKPVSAIIWARKSQFDFRNTTFTDIRLPYPSSVQAKKLGNETVMYRLCSPNYSAAFDFSPYANNGCLAFDVSCVYKPFTPYIHINPFFNSDGLYGGNYNDARGLICSGDFSLTQTRDAWVNYELQNKNYQQIFNRQIESMELQQDIGKSQDIANMIVGSLQGTAQGAMMGGMSGNPYAAAGGAVIGGMSSFVGGALDVNMNDQLRRDQIDAAKDNFAFNIANIKALPDTLTKVSAYNQQNKIFPFVEMYDATDEEKEYFKEQLKYQGMVINRVGTLSEYIDFDKETFFQAILIRGEDAWETHTTNFIAEQLARGIYIGGNE